MPDLPQDPEHWKRIAHLLDEALELPPEEQARYLNTACGEDPELRAQVETLLAADRQAGDFLETPAFEAVDSAALLEAVETLAGDRSVGPYEVVREVGAGGMGTVYEAIDSRLRRRVALKILAHAYMRDPEARTRFMREARAASKLDHPNICPVHDIGTTDGGRLFLVMPFYQGQSIQDLLAAGPIPLEQSRDLALQVLRGLQRAHDAGITHRDIKPANLLLSEHGEVKIVDFGIAKSRDEMNITQANRSLGTPAYMSPEQARGEPVDARSDLFSLGVVLYEMIAGRHPFAADTQEGLVRAILHRPHEPLSRAVPDVPLEVAEAVDRLLAKEPEARFATAVAAREALAPPTRRHAPAAGKLIATAAIVAALALGIGYGARFLNDPLPSAPPLTVEEAVVTWGSDERDGRLSPDGRFISFISDRGGQENIWVRPVEGGTPTRITNLSEQLASHAWSPDGGDIAYVVRLADRSLLQFVGRSGGPVRRTVSLDELSGWVQLVRWAGTGLYLLHDEMLYRVDLEASALGGVSAVRGLRIRGADVTVDGTRIVVAAVSGSGTDLWAVEVADGQAMRLTVDQVDKSHPLWLGSGGTRVAYQVDREGDTDLLQFDPRSGRRDLLLPNVGRAEVDVSDDASLVLLTRAREESHIWRFDLRTRKEAQLTDNSLLEFWPVSSRSESGQVVFQRTKSRQRQTYEPFDAELLAANLGANRLEEERLLVGDGFSPSMSASSRWVAFLRRSPSAANAELWAHDLRLQQTVRVARHVQLVGWHLFPLSWMSRTRAWARQSPRLFFVHADDPNRLTIEMADLAMSPISREVIVAAPPATPVTDVALSYDDRLLSYVLRRDAPGSWELWTSDLVGDSERLLFKGDETVDDLRSVGWLKEEGHLVLLASSFAMPSRERGVEILLVDTAGHESALGEAAGAIAGTAVLDPGGVVYVVRVDQGIHNIYGFSLDDRSWRRVTQNTSSGVSFAGLHVQAGDGLLYARQVLHRDVTAITMAPNVSQ